MKIRYLLLKISCIFSLLLPISTHAAYQPLQEDDSLSTTDSNEKVRQLQELIVEGKNTWMEGNKVIFIPRKSERNLATDATSLIENMNTGILTVKNGSIMARGTNPVIIFINGKPANNVDLSTFCLKMQFVWNILKTPATLALPEQNTL